MQHLHWRQGLLGVITLGAILYVFALPPIPQDPRYHAFADQRTVFGIDHFWNILSNLPFLGVGLYGLFRRTPLHGSIFRPAYLAVCLGTLCVAFGSAYYHSAPSTLTLVWDRLPMSVAFMGLFALILHDRISPPLAQRLFWPLVAAGSASVVYWYLTELRGQGDLRAYGLVQFLPMLLIPLMLLLHSGKSLRTDWLWAAVLGYLLAKFAEHFDTGIFHLTGALGGHSLKHVLGALAVLCAITATHHARHEQPG